MDGKQGVLQLANNIERGWKCYYARIAPYKRDVKPFVKKLGKMSKAHEHIALEAPQLRVPKAERIAKQQEWLKRRATLKNR